MRWGFFVFPAQGAGDRFDLLRLLQLSDSGNGIG